MHAPTAGSAAPNKQMQRARTNHKFVLGYAHQRVADLRRYAAYFASRANSGFAQGWRRREL